MVIRWVSRAYYHQPRTINHRSQESWAWVVIRSVSRAYYHQLQLRDYKNINYSSVTTRISELQTCILYPQPYAPGKQGPADYVIMRLYYVYMILM